MIECMKIAFEIDLSPLADEPPKDGQVSVKLPKDQELRFKTLNIRHEKKLSAWMREFALRLMDKVEAQENQEAS